MTRTKEKLMRRLKIIEGQVRGLQEMLEKNAYCIDIITQSSAVKQGLTAVEDILMEGHLGSCVIHQIKNDPNISHPMTKSAMIASGIINRTLFRIASSSESFSSFDRRVS